MLRKVAWPKFFLVLSVFLLLACTVIYYNQVSIGGSLISGVTWYESSYRAQSIGLIMSANSSIVASPNGTKGDDDRFNHRKKQLDEVCQIGLKNGEWSSAEVERYRSKWIRNDNFVLALEKNFLLCVLPKCSSTSWHKLVRDMRDPASANNRLGWQDRQKNYQMSQDLSLETGGQLLNNNDAVRAIAVRHPFGKLISGWNQKLTRGTPYAGFLLEGYPHMQEFTSDRDEKHVMTFVDFANYLAAYGDNYDNLDYHFLPMTDLCQPCLYPFNVVIKQETTTVDSKWVMEKLGVAELPWVGKGPKYDATKAKDSIDIIRSYFKDVKRETILKLMDIYFYDFALFGYGFEPDTLEALGLS